MGTKLILTGSVVTALGFAGCGSTATVNSKDVSPTTIYQIYTGAYDAGTKSLTLSAQFRVGDATGTTVRLSDGSAVQIDGQAMQLVDGDKAQVRVDGTLYDVATTTTAPAALYNFHWTQNDGKANDNALTMAEAVAVVSPAAGTTFAKNHDLTLGFDGADVINGEAVTFELLGTSASCSTTLGKTCVIAATSLKDVPVGPAHVVVTRSWSKVGTGINGGNGNGTMRSSYRSAPIALTSSP